VEKKEGQSMNLGKASGKGGKKRREILYETPEQTEKRLDEERGNYIWKRGKAREKGPEKIR